MIFMLGTFSVPVVATRLGRSVDAIIRRLDDTDKGLKRRAIESYGMSIPEVARAMGVNESTADRWVRSGKLQSHKAKLIRGVIRAVDSDDLIVWLESGYALAPLLQPTGDWIDAVSDARAKLSARYISGREITKLLQVGNNFLASYSPGRGRFIKPAMYLGTWGGGNYYDRTLVREWLNERPQYWTKQARESL